MKPLLALVLVLLLTACGGGGTQNAGGGGGGETIDEPPQEGFAVSPSVLVFNQLGSTADLQVSGINSSVAVNWQSSNEAVVVVDDQGVVTAIAEGEAVITASTDTETAQAEITVSTTAYTIAGTITYVDKQYATGGFTGKTSSLPVRYAVVELVDSQDRVLYTSVTDAGGAYAFGAFLDTGSRVRVLAKTNESTLPEIKVTDYSGATYAAGQTVELNSQDATMDVEVNEASGGGAFNILDAFTYGGQFIGSMSSVSLPALQAIWQDGSSSLGTYFCQGLDFQYCPQGSGIYLLGGGSPFYDTDQYDDDVLWHEFSHYLEYHFAIADSPGGAHAFTDNDLDLRLAWSEGFGDFFPTAVKAWLKDNHPEALSQPASLSTSVYIDTAGNFANMVNIGNPGGTPFVYSSSEIAVANVMDQLRKTYGMAALWAVYENQLPTLTLPVNLEGYWDGWLQQHLPDSLTLAQMESMYADRLIYYQQDGFEADDSSGEARLIVPCLSGDSCTGEVHYLYRDDLSDDSDYVYFNAAAGTTYAIETHNLSNGADTMLRLYDSNGGLLNENDDRAGNTCCLPNDDLTLSSKITFTADATASYYIEILTSTDMALSAGRYGTYAIKVTEQ